MKKFLILIISIILTMFTCACDNEQSVILFNKHVIMPDTIVSPTSNTNVFKPGERIYYLITLPKPVETKSLFIQVVSVDGDKDERLGYDLVWSRRVRLKDNQVRYYTDYVVFNQKGPYIMKVYSRDNPTQILTTGSFYIK
jgi:hypothetical protein